MSEGVKIATKLLDDFTGTRVKEILELRPWMKGKKFILLTRQAAIEKYINECIEKGLAALDFETTGLNTRLDPEGKPYDEIVGVCLAHDPYEGVYICVAHEDAKEYNVSLKFMISQLSRLAANCRLIFHNFKFDGQILKNNGIIIDDISMFEDTLLMAAIEDASRKEKKLKYLSRVLLDRDQLEIQDMGIKGNKKDIVAFEMIPPQKAVYYGAGDGMNTMALYLYFKERLEKVDPTHIYRIEKLCLLVTLEMESNLVKVDIPYLKETLENVDNRIEKILTEIYDIAGHSFDLNSPQQLGNVLFNELKLPYPKGFDKTKTGHYQTNENLLKKVDTKNPIVDLILTHRGYIKVKSTYILNMINNADENDEIKFQLNQVQADTGRFSGTGGKGFDIDGYSGVNCQNIPKFDHKDPHSINLRRAIIAHPGYKIVSIDYSGEELRIAANFSREPKWINEFLHGTGDLHTITGQIITGKSNISEKERKLGKCVAKGTLIASEYGWVPIESLKKGDKVITHTGELKEITDVWDMGVKPGIRIETRTGHRITSGLNHRYLTGNDEWVRAEDLSTGMMIKTVSCANMNKQIIQRVHFNIWDKGNNNNSSEELPYIEISPRWARLLGYIFGDSDEKDNPTRHKSLKVFRVPSIIFTSPKYVIKEFLSALFETNGTVGNGTSITTKDRDFAEDLVLLLAMFGIRACIWDKFYKKYDRMYYKVSFGVEGSIIFEKEIGFISNNKKERLYKLTHKQSKTHSGTFKTKWLSEVKTLTPTGGIHLYDLTVKGDSTYVAQGLVTHNTVNFLTMYGGGAGGFSAQAKIPYTTAKKMIINFFKEYSGLNNWIKIEWKKSRERKYSRTAFGRRRPLKEFYDSTDKGIQAKGDRCAINSAIQGCLTKEEYCLTDKYGYISIGYIEELMNKGESLKIWTGTTWEVFDVLNRGECQLATIELSNGMLLRCDTRHEVLVVGKNGYEFRHFKDLDENTNICVSIPRLLNTGFYPDSYISKKNGHATDISVERKEQWDELAYVIGVLTGGGDVQFKSGQIRFCFGAEKLTKVYPRIKKFFRSLNLHVQEPYLNRGAKGESYIISINSTSFIGLLVSFGFDKNGAMNKTVPKKIFSAPVDMRRAFLRGYFDTDGCKKRRNRYGYHTSNRELLREIQLIGWTLGLPSIVRDVKNGNYKLEWQDLKKAEEFLDLSPKEWKRLNVNNNMLLPEFLRDHVKSVLYPVYDRKDRNECSYFYKLNKGRKVTLAGMVSFMEKYNCEMPEEVYYHYRLKRKTVINKKEDTYTLSVHSDLHRFDSAGIISKNTGADIIKIALWRVYRWIKENNLEDDIRILLPVHDEIVYEIKEDKLNLYIPELCNIMKLRDLTDKLNWIVPLEVDAEYGDSFHVDHDYWKEVDNKEVDNKENIEQENIESVGSSNIKDDIYEDSEDKVYEKSEDNVVLNQESSVDPNVSSTSSEAPHYYKSFMVKDMLIDGLKGDKEAINELSKTKGNELVPLYTDAHIRERIDKQGFLNYPIDSNIVAAQKLRFIFEAIKAGGDSLYIGPKYRICILNKKGEVLYRSSEEISIDAFLALCLMLDI